LREAPRDSILALMPLLDAQLARADFVPGNPWNLRAVVERNGDSAMLHRWSLRMARVGLRSMDLVGRQEDLRDPELRDSAEAGARLMLARIAPIRGPTAQRTRAYSYSILASVALARGDYRRAIALTDSTRVGRCIWAGEATRALAFLALGDTASAERHLLPYAKAEWSGADTVRRLLGARVRDPHWLTAVDSTFRERNACRAKEQGLD
ncbi:MAG TPA: hypothetical protein VHM30_02625, partial [Gemmatimonadaceae bacterium]|nr:hypothetical protein [Gemmatimonadaceae bacterium]